MQRPIPGRMSLPTAGSTGSDVCRYIISQQCVVKVDVYSTNLAAEWLYASGQ